MHVRVRDVMSSPALTVTPDTPLPIVQRLMTEHEVRRLPVVHKHRVVGIITSGDLRNALPSDATTLSIYELSYLVEKIHADEVMSKTVVIIEADAPLAKAAQLMLEHKISGLPVLDKQQLVGMITESDIFRAVVSGQAPILATFAAPTHPEPIRARHPIV
jgi:CBS domain-containing protein